ncbi:pseudouridine synthase [Blautia sp. MSJ-19]|uniref:pseudouridine synthase n=1 Tax=Blautia sp. MSJ-19 TaxID=2841517 RepID=UPI001C0EB70F|nr:pseudouridine synthase [Blautia sp. MSJ-19]MBU5479974.1 rRNA pseudouridine synthase [Blautia sp. MSJ-19]
MAKAVRLDKFLADAGKGTRSEVKKFIQKGQVQVNGVPAKKPELKVDPDNDMVVLSGETVGAAPEFVYYLLNKPAGCVSATEDRNDRTVMEYVPSERKGLFPVGRLDKDTEGLLLITDDGMLAHELLAPGKHVDKTYFVRVEGRLTVENIEKLEKGVDIGEDKRTMPAKAEIVGGSWEGVGEPQPGRVRRENLPEVYTELLLTIHEGKFHQVKRMMAAVGTPVIYLKRVSMGPLTLPDDLKKGECRPLTAEEIMSLKQ